MYEWERNGIRTEGWGGGMAVDRYLEWTLAQLQVVVVVALTGISMIMDVVCGSM